MDINRANMDALFTTYRVAFTEAMQRGMQIPAGIIAEEFMHLNELAMTVVSGGAQTVHAWLNQLPGFRRWLGDRQKKDLASGKLTVVNADWEDTVAVPRNDIEDDNYGIYTPLMANLGIEGSDDCLWLDAAVAALLANANWADGLPFFGTTRKYGANAIVNSSVLALNAANLETAQQLMQAYLGPENNPVGGIISYLLVGPTQRGPAWDIVKNQWVSSGTGKGGSIQNRAQGLAQLKVHPGIRAPTRTIGSSWPCAAASSRWPCRSGATQCSFHATA